ncbi:hypothetical protein PM082_022245 [Marasmius tenuissimus]|nr:hypothetical protein PM082_022245 [Marasmius tenuissimus]
MSPQSLELHSIQPNSSNFSRPTSPSRPAHANLTTPLGSSSVHNSPRKSKNTPFKGSGAFNTPISPSNAILDPENVTFPDSFTTPRPPQLISSSSTKRHRGGNISQNSTRKRSKITHTPTPQLHGEPVTMYPAANGFVLGQGFHTLFTAGNNILSYSSFHSTPKPHSRRTPLPKLPYSLAARMEDPQLSPNIRGSFRSVKVEVEVVIPPGNLLKEKREIIYTSDQQKVDALLWFLKKKLGWTYGEMLWYTSQRGGPGLRSDTQTQSFANYLQGRDGTAWPSKVVNTWFCHPAGRNNRDALYAFEPLYDAIKPVRQGLSAFATQLIEQKLIREAEHACRSKEIRMRFSTRLHRNEVGLLIHWDQFDSGNQAFLRGFYATRQPVGWRLVKSMALRKVKGVFVERQRWPVEPVLTNTFGRLNYSRTSRANRGPLSDGMLYHAFLAPTELFCMQSRTAGTPSLSTTTLAMKLLAAEELAILAKRGKNLGVLDVYRVDNVHNHGLQRDEEVGRQNKLYTGFYGASFEAEKYVDVSAFDLARFEATVTQCDHSKVTADQLYGLVDEEHLSTVLALQYVRALTDHIPEMKESSPEVTGLYRTHATKLQLPVRKTAVHPFAACSKNEMIYTELRDGLLDFLEQNGQTAGSYKPRKQPCGGVNLFDVLWPGTDR